MENATSNIINFSDPNINDSLLIITVPIWESESDTNYLNIYAKSSDYSTNNFNNFIITYLVPLEKNYDDDGIFYGNYIIDIYGLNASISVEEDEEHNLVARTFTNQNYILNIDEPEIIIPPFNQNNGIVVPTMACIDASLDKLDCTCKGWCRIVKKLANTIVGVADHADIATAVLFCSSNNNSPWGSGLTCPED